MKAIKTILVPTDFSNQAAEALEEAAALALSLKARMVLFHVIERPIATTAYYGFLTIPGGAVSDLAALRDGAAQELERISKPYRGEVRTEVSVTDGFDAATEIVAAIDRFGADLVVMATHGRRGLNRLLLGSVTERIIRTAHVPILAIPPKGEAAAQALRSAGLPSTTKAASGAGRKEAV